ncbi:unnamed protein product [Oreochromis niloticus]|nr:unnamed protein product [Mustela putorius furo]
MGNTTNCKAVQTHAPGGPVKSSNISNGTFWVQGIAWDILPGNWTGTTRAAEPSVTNLDQTNDWALLKCVVKGASPKPTVEWWDSNSQTIPSEEPQVSKKGERFYVTLKTNVTKTDRYHCVAKQKEIWHQAHTEINVRLNVPEPKTGWIVAGVAVVLVVVLAVVVGILSWCCIKNKKKKTTRRNRIPLSRETENQH